MTDGDRWQPSRGGSPVLGGGGDGGVDLGLWAPLVRRYVRWYPAGWREEYGDEFRALLVDTLDDGGWGPRLWMDVVRGGLTARAERFGLIADREGPGRRSVAAGALAAVTAGVFLLACWAGSRFVQHWRSFPLEESVARRGLKFTRLSPDSFEMSDYPGHYRVGTVTDVAGRVSVVCLWVLVACLIAAAGAIAVGFWRSGRTAGRSGWRLPALSLGVPLSASAMAEILGHVNWAWVWQDHPGFVHATASSATIALPGLGSPLRGWARLGVHTLLVVSLLVVLGGVIHMASRCEVTRSLGRSLSRCAAATVAVMGVTVGAVLVWGISLAATVPEVLLDRTVTHRLSGVPVDVTILGRRDLTVGLFGTPLWSTLTIIGLVLVGTFTLALGGIRRTRASAF